MSNDRVLAYLTIKEGNLKVKIAAYDFDKDNGVWYFRIKDIKGLSVWVSGEIISIKFNTRPIECAEIRKTFRSV